MDSKKQIQMGFYQGLGQAGAYALLGLVTGLALYLLMPKGTQSLKPCTGGCGCTGQKDGK